MKKRIIFCAILACLVSAVSAQTQYKHSVGLSVGSMNGVSYKAFINNDICIQTDLAFKLIGTVGGNADYTANISMWDFELNPNVMYQANITGWNWGGVDWYAGGGLSLGLLRAFDSGYNLGKFGINAIGGAELGLDDAPLAFSLDFRPGYGLAFDGEGSTLSYFDWAVVAGIRYTF